MKTREWTYRQSRDIFVKGALKEGYVSRSAFKLIEIEKKYNIINNSHFIIELGSSPGGWTQVINQIKKNKNYKLICIDKINMKIKENNNNFFIKSDFINNNIVSNIQKIHKKKFNLILSDMSPNTTGHKHTDHLKIINIAQEVLKFSKSNLSNNGSMIIKIFHGSDEKLFVKELKKNFLIVDFFKPNASRKESSEIYIVCLKYKL